MNCVELLANRIAERPAQPALLIPGSSAISFAELGRYAGSVQILLRRHGLQPGDSILVFDQLSYRLYASIIGMLGAGITVQLIEPWMPVSRIERVVELTRPKAFWCNWIGRFWGSRVRAIRNIPLWIAPPGRREGGALGLADVAPDHAGVITFTSGTTGDPKGVLRSHGYLQEQHRVLSTAFADARHPGPDLCIFANFALGNLASGRTSILMPSSWKPSTFEGLRFLPDSLQPTTVTCGPAFLMKLLRHADLPRLEAIHVGGALSDCWIFEQAFRKWPRVEISHVYGSSEVEPVAHGDARELVRESRARGLFQTLALGRASPEIHADLQKDGLWVAGPHVCPKYVGNEEESRRFKKLDTDGRLWHFMGDRVAQLGDTFWYQGRSAQSAEDFALEQKIYQHAQSSTSFIHRTPRGERILIACRLPRVLNTLPYSLRQEISGVLDIRAIRRDRRHRARIDRLSTIRKELPLRDQQWLLGN